MKRIGLFVNPAKPEAAEVLKRIREKAADLDLSLVCVGETADILCEAEAVAEPDAAGRIDLMMALGGDGTMLRAARCLQGADIPVVGVNLGSLGFMTSITIDQLEEAMEALHKGAYATSTRTMAECEVWRNGRCDSTHLALNDIVIGWGTLARVVHLELRIDGEEVTTYACDGIIVSTPTGSTGHSLSASGPILHPETRVLLVNVICPHTLSARPMVLPDKSTLEITAANMVKDKNLLLSVDGQQLESFCEGDRLIVRKHPTGIRFVHLPGYSYFDVLRRKLHWRGSTAGH